jgi:DNA-binding MarR family transcriptional regulator
MKHEKVKSQPGDPAPRTFILDPMRRIERAVHRDLEGLMTEIGYPEVRAPHLAVFAIVPRGEGMRMSQLAERMQLTRGAVTQLVSYLEGHGLLKRVPDPDDGRGIIVKPTRAAHRGYEEGRRRIAELEDEWARRIGPKKWAMFKSVLNELANWADSEDQPAPPRGV